MFSAQVIQNYFLFIITFSNEKTHFPRECFLLTNLSFSLFIHDSDQEVNRKRGRREHRNNNRYSNPNQVGNSSRRGDISIIHGDCDGNLFKSFFLKLPSNNPSPFFTENLVAKMNDLIALVKKLEKDISNQHGDVRRLQSLIENCAGC